MASVRDLERVSDIFHIIDADGDGALTPNELKAGLMDVAAATGRELVCRASRTHSAAPQARARRHLCEGLRDIEGSVWARPTCVHVPPFPA